MYFCERSGVNFYVFYVCCESLTIPIFFTTHSQGLELYNFPIAAFSSKVIQQNKELSKSITFPR